MMVNLQRWESSEEETSFNKFTVVSDKSFLWMKLFELLRISWCVHRTEEFFRLSSPLAFSWLVKACD